MEASERRYAAGCLCGAVRLVAHGAPLRVGICHCLDCRKHHGALFYAAAVFADGSVSISGETASYKGRHFCPRCGSSVFARSGGEIELDKSEKAMLDKSIDAVKGLVEACKGIDGSLA